MRFSIYMGISLLWAGFSSADVCDKAVNITSQSDADGISSCTTVSYITIANDVMGSIEFPKLEKVTGNLSTSAANLDSLSAPKLGSVGGALELSGTGSLKKLDLSSLSSVGSFLWYKSAAVPSYSFSDSGLTTAGSVWIVQTGIKSISWLKVETIENLSLALNPGLDTANLSTLKNFTGEIVIEGEEAEISISLPKATAGASLAVENSIQSFELDVMQNLTKLTMNSTSLTEFTAPELTEMRSIELHGNDHLTSFSMPKLKTISNITYDDYDIATNFSFPVLNTIEENAIFSSNLSDLVFPEIEHIYGTFNASGFNYETMSCPEFRERYIASTYKIYCNLISVTTRGGDSGYSSTESITNSSNARPTTSTTSSSSSAPDSRADSGESGSTSSSTGGSSNSGGLSSGAKAGIAIGVIVGALAIAGAAFFFVRRRRASGDSEGFLQSSAADRPSELSAPETAEAPNTQRFEAPGSHSEMSAELEQPRPRMELE
ncbi:GPI-anchored cell wall organization protein Ecm33 [Penicillium angulare]|uniref:GPI-anchored cell wall organization protein Ecm33 n=1 Tax=Penicillium angulare TaxID=116970 RepID=UPI00253F6E86|nr:GPI-anchored cell wall organization protein Ecm33 [Penicillium angulare]KAJ5279044.1 GPI-anchored cell wall organization protein Ecm33 [Penicillium angulare]